MSVSVFNTLEELDEWVVNYPEPTGLIMVKDPLSWYQYEEGIRYKVSAGTEWVTVEVIIGDDFITEIEDEVITVNNTAYIISPYYYPPVRVSVVDSSKVKFDLTDTRFIGMVVELQYLRRVV